jgi:hypothetical protein
MENQEKQNMSKPHVHLFGEEIKPRQGDHNKCCHHHEHYDRHCGCHHDHGCRHHNMGGIWGLGVLFVGVILLLTNIGVISHDIWNYILPLWPVLLVLAGLRIIAGFSPAAHLLIFLLTLATFCLIFLYGLSSVDSSLLNYFHLPTGLLNFISQFK